MDFVVINLRQHDHLQNKSPQSLNRKRLNTFGLSETVCIYNLTVNNRSSPKSLAWSKPPVAVALELDHGPPAIPHFEQIHSNAPAGKNSKILPSYAQTAFY